MHQPLCPLVRAVPVSLSGPQVLSLPGALEDQVSHKTLRPPVKHGNKRRQEIRLLDARARLAVCGMNRQWCKDSGIVLLWSLTWSPFRPGGPSLPVWPGRPWQIESQNNNQLTRKCLLLGHMETNTLVVLDPKTMFQTCRSFLIEGFPLVLFTLLSLFLSHIFIPSNTWGASDWASPQQPTIKLSEGFFCLFCCPTQHL